MYQWILFVKKRDITQEKKEQPVEVIPNTNSTGIISSIRNRLSTQDIIEITDTLSDVEDEDIISHSNSMSLISKEEFNAVLFPFSDHL